MNLAPKPSRRGRIAGAALLAVLAAALLGSAAPRAEADSPETAVIDWNKHALDALANAPGAAIPGAGQTTPVLAVHLPIVQGAVYDAVNAIDRGHEPYLDGLPAAPSNASRAAAVATAAHDTLVAILNQVPAPAAGPFTPGVRAAVIARLDDLRDDALAAAAAEPGATPSKVSAGIDAGEAAADAMIEERSTGGVPDDGRYPATPAPFPVGTEPGQWRPTPTVNDPFGWVRNVVPFVVESDTQFLSKGPRDLKSGAYAKEYNEVKTLGIGGTAGLANRTEEQQKLVDFFQPNPVELYTRAFRGYALAEGLDVAEQARLFAKLAFAGADAFITCWEDKAHWSFWRPVTAINLGEDDGNRKTQGDPTWTPAVATPPYPDHSSGYNCSTGSLMEVAEGYFGHGRTTFTLVHPTLPLSRTYLHFRDVTDDTIDARVFQGIHFRSADEQGAGIGRDVARWIDKHALQPAK